MSTVRVLWRRTDVDFDDLPKLLAESLRTALDGLSTHRAPTVVLERAHRLERDVGMHAAERWPDRPVLSRALAHAAFVDAIWNVASPADRPSPITSLRALWATGYVLSAVDASAVTLQIPRL
jgi:hypothetical protein